MPKTKVLITVKTYPTLSGQYDELVCTAGFREDGSWIRIYPIPFRKLDYDNQYSKYEWIELDLVKNDKDFRPESYRPYSIDTKITRIRKVDTKNYWQERKDTVLRKVHYDLEALIEEAKDETKHTSLAVFKPTEIIDFTITETEREWDKKRIDKIKANRDQQNLFEHPEDPFEVVNKLPYVFRYRFKDSKGKESHLMIEDWEIGALYWNMLKKYEGDESKAIKDVRKKYFDDFAKTKDLHLFLGTTWEHHSKKAKNPFVIIGTFTPKIKLQQTLF